MFNMNNKIFFIIYLFFFVVFFVHVSIIAFFSKNPANPSIRVYKKDLDDLGYFPISLKLCAKQEDVGVNNVFRKFGYSFDYNFYIGESLYNKSIKGWNGHTENGTTITSLNGEHWAFSFFSLININS